MNRPKTLMTSIKLSCGVIYRERLPFVTKLINKGKDGVERGFIYGVG